MKIAGSYVVEAPREEVWSALNDIEVLARTIPGCQRLDQVGENSFETTLKVGLQAVKGVYTGHVTLSDIQPPHHYRISVDGKGSNGFLRGEGGIELTEDEPGKTTLVYSGDANIGGTLATVGQRLIEGASRTLINQALKAFTVQVQARMSGSSAAEAPEAVAEAAAPAAPDAAAAASEVATIPASVLAAPAAESNGIAPDGSGLSSTTVVTPAPAPRKTVVVPEHEQLKPESLVLGIAQDFLNERPWLPWVIGAFLIGWLLGRRR